MNKEQLLSLVRLLGMALGTFLGTKYGVDAAQVSSAVNLFVAAVGAVLAAGSTIWSIYQNTHKATIAKAADISSVEKIILADPVKADAIPSSKVVSS